MCPEWKAQQKILWAKVREEAARGKSQFKIWDLLADEGCSQTRSRVGVGACFSFLF